MDVEEDRNEGRGRALLKQRLAADDDLSDDELDIHGDVDEDVYARDRARRKKMARKKFQKT